MATFIDMAPAAVLLLEKNLRSCRLQERARIFPWDIERNLNCLQAHGLQYDLIFLDPPYALAEDEQSAQDLVKLMTELHRVATPDCFLSFRTETGVTPQPVEGWDGPTSHAYGSMTLHFFIRQTPA